MSLEFTLDTPALRISAREAPWDSAVFGKSVIVIETIEVVELSAAISYFKSFRNWLNANQVGLVSCRLSHRNLIESMFLESQEFRFIEMVLHPYFSNLDQFVSMPDGFDIQAATAEDLDDLIEIAETAFSSERFHFDPRIPCGVGDKRYGAWVRDCLYHPKQRLLKISEGKIIGFFITLEPSNSRRVDWLLTALSPSLRGLGYGKRVWHAMLSFHKTQGKQTVSTTISARNTRVLNLYSQLQFRFKDPEMTFHWVREIL